MRIMMGKMLNKRRRKKKKKRRKREEEKKKKEKKGVLIYIQQIRTYNIGQIRLD